MVKKTVQMKHFMHIQYLVVFKFLCYVGHKNVHIIAQENPILHMYDVRTLKRMNYSDGQENPDKR